MFRNVFLKDLRDQRRGLLGWSIGTALTVVVMAAIWPTFAHMDITALLDQYPQSLKEIFNVADMSTGAGYLNAELFSLMLPVLFAVFGISRAARLVAGEEEDGTLEVLATMPISRTRLLAQKAAVLVACLLVLTLVLYVATVGSSLAFGLDVGAVAAARGSASMFLLGLELASIAFAVGAVRGRRGLAVGLASAAAGAAYLWYLVAQLVDGLHGLRSLSPFYQATALGPIAAALPGVAWAMPAVALVALAASFAGFRHRDLLL